MNTHIVYPTQQAPEFSYTPQLDYPFPENNGLVVGPGVLDVIWYSPGNVSISPRFDIIVF